MRPMTTLTCAAIPVVLASVAIVRRAAPPPPASCSVAVAPSTVSVHAGRAEVVAFLRDTDGLPLPGRAVRFELSGPGRIVGEAPARSDIDGTARILVGSARPGRVRVSVRLDGSEGACGAVEAEFVGAGLSFELPFRGLGWK